VTLSDVLLIFTVALVVRVVFALVGRPAVKRRLALKLHGWAYKLEPMIPVAVRNAVIQQLADEHQAKQQAQANQLAAHRQRAARAARNN